MVFFSHSFKSQYVKVIPSLLMELRDTKSWVYIMNIFIVRILKQNSHIPDNHCQRLELGLVNKYWQIN